MIKINKVRIENFVAIVTGNQGEEQMIVISSPLRMGTEDLIIAAVTVQGGARVVRNTRVGPESEVRMVIEQALVHWCAQGAGKVLGITDAERIAWTLNAMMGAWESGRVVEIAFD